MTSLRSARAEWLIFFFYPGVSHLKQSPKVYPNSMLSANYTIIPLSLEMWFKSGWLGIADWPYTYPALQCYASKYVLALDCDHLSFRTHCLTLLCQREYYLQFNFSDSQFNVWLQTELFRISLCNFKNVCV